MTSRPAIAVLTSFIVAFACSAQADEPSVYLMPQIPAAAAPTDADIEAAKASYARAHKLFSKAKFAKALDHARTAFRAVPKASSALVVATILAQMKRPCEATEQLMLALELVPHEDDLAKVQGQLAEQSRKCGAGVGAFEVTPADATVSLAGRGVPAGVRMAVAAGQYKVEVSAAGHATQQADLTVAAGAPFSFSAALTPLPPPPPPAPEPKPVAVTPPPQPPAPVVAETPGADAGDHSLLGWSLVGSGAASTIGGIVLYALAVSAADDAAAANALTGVSEQERESRYNDAKSDVDSFQLSAFVVGGVGLAAVTAGAVLLVLDGDDAGAQAMRPTGWWSAEGAFVGVGGRF